MNSNILIICISDRVGLFQLTNILNSLYKYARVFVYPSLYEGFWMPILEAFANNSPICISNTSCFPEIASNAVYILTPMM